MKISSILKLAPQIAAFCLIPLYAISGSGASPPAPIIAHFPEKFRRISQAG